MSDKSKLMLCPHCGNRTVLEGRAEYRDVTVDWDSDANKLYITHWRILQCLSCRKIVLQQTSHSETDNYLPADFEEKILYPVVRPTLTNLPVTIERAYRAALKVQNIEPNACAVLVGRTLEAACNHENANGKVLADKLNYLAESGRIPPTLAQMARQLKQLRNLGAHDAEDEITEEDVPIILDFLEAILEYLYVAPAKIAAVQARLNREA